MEGSVEELETGTRARHVLFIFGEALCVVYNVKPLLASQRRFSWSLTRVCGWQASLWEVERCSLYSVFTPSLPMLLHVWRSSVPAWLVYLFSPNTIYWRLIYMWRSGAISPESVPSTTWILGTKLRVPDLVAQTFTKCVSDTPTRMKPWALWMLDRHLNLVHHP